MRYANFLGALVLALLFVAFVPLVAAAHSVDAIPILGQADLFTTVKIMGLAAGVGVVISLEAKEAGQDVTIQLDGDSEDTATFLQNLKRYVKLKVAESVAPLQSDNEALEKQKEALTAYLVADTLRLKKATDTKLDADAEQKYLQGLSPDRLEMEHDRALKAFDATPVTQEGTVPESEESNPYIEKEEGR